MYKQCLWFLAVTLLFSSSSLRAAIVLTVVPSSASFVEGDSGFIDVMISSTSSDALDGYLFDLNITGGSGAVFGVQLDAFLTDSNYVFFGRSANVADSLAASTISGGGSVATLADNSYDFASPPNALPFTLPGSGSPSLLARLQFNAVSIGSFTVDINAATSSFSDANFDPFAFTSTGGTFNVTAVPEPGSMILVGLIGFGGVMYRRRIGKRKIADTRIS
jgi:hypothetical protein